VVGKRIADFSAPDEHAFLWRDGVMTDLGTPGGNSSEALDIDDDGRVVGASTDTSGLRHALLWRHGAATELGALFSGGLNGSSARGINEWGQIVGFSDVASGGLHAVLWS
jgi:probable HAF family extracellular repeat protein